MNTNVLKDNIVRLIHENKIHTVRVCASDNTNVQRSRYSSSDHFINKVMEDGLSLPSVVFSFDTSAKINQRAGSGYKSGYPSWIVKPDMHTFGLVPYLQGTARVIGDIFYPSGQPISFAPRYILKKVLEMYEKEGIKVRGAYEYEFFVFKPNSIGGYEPIWDGKQCYSEIKQNGVEEILRDVMLNLTAIGAGTEIANIEYASGQFEVTNSPFWGIDIADMAFYYRTSIKEIITQKGLIASFMSKPLANQCGSGAHLHISLYDNNNNNLLKEDKSPDGLSDICHNFIGGQIKHANALCALINPTINSYKRLQEYMFAPTTKTWGYEHRGAMIRVPFCRDSNTRIENRLAGSDTNPYISLAAILASGLDGIKNNIDPGAPCTEIDTYSEDLPRLPRTLIDAIKELKQDTYFKEILGEEFLYNYITLRESEWDRYMNHISDWELTEYMDLI
jgi:glutamine synthetase